LFTDNPVTPMRLEALIDLLREYPGLTRQQVKSLLQPRVLGEDHGYIQAQATLRAATDLELIVEDVDEMESADEMGSADKRLHVKGSASVATRSLIETALDARVLGSTDVEPYFALFYAFVHGCTESGSNKWTNVQWSSEFNDRAYPGGLPDNPFNPTKLSALRRWFDYAGLGWFDPAGNFQPCPYGRVQRALPTIFHDQEKMLADEFMRRLALTCPELDGGRIFLRVHPDTEPRTLQRPLAQALVELHLDGVLRLHAAPDSQGWDMGNVEPPRDKATLRGDRLDEVEVR
jgi:hypothetical protein